MLLATSTYKASEKDDACVYGLCKCGRGASVHLCVHATCSSADPRLIEPRSTSMTCRNE